MSDRLLCALVLLLTIAGSGMTVSPGSEEVVMVVEMIRHGARMPVYAVLDVAWVKGLSEGKLTPIGYRQHYLLGMEMAKQYPSLFSKGLSHKEYYARSTGMQRTFASATSHLLGMWNHFNSSNLVFANGDERISSPAATPEAIKANFNTPLQFGFTPPIVHTETIPEDDFLFILNSEKCMWANDASDDIMRQIMIDVERDSDFEEKMAEVFDRYDLEYAANNLYSKCMKVSDFAVMDVIHNPNPRIKENEDLFRHLAWCYESAVAARYIDKDITKMSISNIMMDIESTFDRKIANKTPLKLKLLSAHDSTLAPFYVAFGLLNPQCYFDKKVACGLFPGVANNIVFELIELENRHFVRVRVNFDPVDICGLKNKDSGYRCPYEQFKIWLDTKIDRNWMKGCGYPDPGFKIATKPLPNLSAQWNTWKTAFFVLGFISFFIFLGILLVCRALYKPRRAQLKGTNYIIRFERGHFIDKN